MLAPAGAPALTALAERLRRRARTPDSPTPDVTTSAMATKRVLRCAALDASVCAAASRVRLRRLSASQPSPFAYLLPLPFVPAGRARKALLQQQVLRRVDRDPYDAGVLVHHAVGRARRLFLADRGVACGSSVNRFGPGSAGPGDAAALISGTRAGRRAARRLRRSRFTCRSRNLKIPAMIPGRRTSSRGSRREPDDAAKADVVGSGPAVVRRSGRRARRIALVSDMGQSLP